MECPKCRHEIHLKMKLEELVYCPYCEQRMIPESVPCPGCGSLVLPDAPSCPACGLKLAAEETAAVQSPDAGCEDALVPAENAAPAVEESRPADVPDMEETPVPAPENPAGGSGDAVVSGDSSGEETLLQQAEDERYFARQDAEPPALEAKVSEAAADTAVDLPAPEPAAPACEETPAAEAEPPPVAPSSPEPPVIVAQEAAPQQAAVEACLPPPIPLEDETVADAAGKAQPSAEAPADEAAMPEAAALPSPAEEAAGTAPVSQTSIQPDTDETQIVPEAPAEYVSEKIVPPPLPEAEAVDLSEKALDTAAEDEEAQGEEVDAASALAITSGHRRNPPSEWGAAHQPRGMECSARSAG